MGIEMALDVLQIKIFFHRRTFFGRFVGDCEWLVRGMSGWRSLERIVARSRTNVLAMGLVWHRGFLTVAEEMDVRR